MPTRKFKAQDYAKTNRSQLIKLVAAGVLSKANLDAIAALPAPNISSPTWYPDRVRRVLRYWLARKKTAKSGGSDIPKTINSFLKPLEDTNWFKFAGGYKGFGVMWDVGKTAPFSIVPLEKSLLEQWDEVMLESVVELIDDGDGNLRVPTPAEEAEQKRKRRKKDE